MKSIRPNRVLGGLWEHAAPVLSLNAHDSTDGFFCGCRRGQIQETVRWLTHQGLGHRQGRLRNGSEVVSSLLHRQHQPLKSREALGHKTNLQADSNLAIGNSHEHMGHVSIARGRNKAATQNIAGSSVEPSRNYVWSEMFTSAGKPSALLITRSGSNSVAIGITTF